MTQHRWSGWPGAWCMDCGISDPYEIALAEGYIDFDDDNHATFNDAEVEEQCRKKMICTEPGSKRFDPYARSIQGNTPEHSNR